MGKEIWKPVVGYEGLYEVSNVGRVRSLPRDIIQSNGKKIRTKGKILILWLQNKGYKMTCLRRDNRSKFKLVHQLVGKAFIPNPDNKPFIDHINGNRSDNRVENLRWCTAKENSNFELAKKHASDAIRGKTGVLCPNSKSVSQFTLDGKYIRTFGSGCEAERETGIDQGRISLVCRGKRRQTGGYIWRYNNIK